MIPYLSRIMGGGFMFAGNSGAARPLYFPSGIPRNFQTPNSATMNICNGSQPVPQNIGDGFLRPVPSRFEVERAILELQRFMSNLPGSKSEQYGLQELLYDHELEMLQSPGFNKLSDAFFMMQQEQSLQNLVVSISCDESVWDAIMINEAVQGLRGSFSTESRIDSMNADKEEKLLRSPEEPDISVLIMRWIMGFTRAKVLELLEKFGSLVKELLEPGSKEKPTSELTDLLDEKLRSSFLLSFVILLIVVITRGQG